jgi:hypothetical protein
MRWRKAEKSEPGSTITTAGPDEVMHDVNRVCGRCQRAISPRQEARRTATGDWVHLVC